MLNKSVTAPRGHSNTNNLLVSKPRRRSRSKHHLGLTAQQHSTFRAMRRAIASCNGACDWPVAKFAAFIGISPSQFQRDRRVIVDQRRLIVKIERAGTVYQNDTNLWMLPQLATPTPPAINDREKQRLLSAFPADAASPVADAPGLVSVVAKNAPPLHRNGHKAKPRRRWNHWRFRKSAVQLAAEHVLSVLGFSKDSWITRRSIEHSIRMWMQMNPGKCPNAAANRMVIHWHEYQQAGPFRLSKCGVTTFFGECRWRDRNSWPWDLEAIRLQCLAKA